MRYIYFVPAAALGTMLAVLGTPPRAFAAQNPCQFEPQFDALSTLLANPKDNDLEHVRAELTIRKSILTNILGCALGEIRGLKDTLDTVPSDDPDIADLARRFQGRLDDANAYYDLQRSRVGDLGIWGSKDMAQTIADRRDSYLNPLTQEIAQFVIWAKNQNLFRVAENRLSQIQTTTKFLKLIDNQETSDRVGKAQESFAKAKELNDAAKQALKRMDISDDSLTLIKNSLEALAETYKNFFEVSKEVAVPQ